MQNFPLCPSCSPRFKKSQHVSRSRSEADCFICRGILSCGRNLLSAALLQSQCFDWRNFSVASSLPRSVLLREEDVADFFTPGEFTSLKNSLNSMLAKDIAAATGKENRQRNADAIFEFDFSKSKSSAKPSQLFISGHYLKLSRSHCQSRWHCSDCKGRGCASCGGSGRNYPSVEEEIGSVLIHAFGAEGCTMHASGREDVDVRMLGGGRPFVMELKSPKKREAGLQALEEKMRSNKNVQALGLKIVGKCAIDAVCGSHFDKEYSALVSADRTLTVSDAKKAERLSGALISQQTPNRVLSRRADLERKRKIHRLSAKPEANGKLRLTILAEAGTYIKELISSDKGRTRPSVSEILGCNAACEELDVAAIRDYFLETLATGPD